MQASGPDDDPSSSNDWWPPDEVDDWGTFPPPPPPPSTGPSSACSGDLYCRIGAEGGPMGAHFDRASFPSLPIVAVCSSVVLVAVLVASFLFWR
ncbi:hypothetical protein JTE90_015772 [Oedothorax gibbosus]|uniref:Uncharacterized protein n=1 Tax=Oedothorax gibbosus TaxID=931172 RepID=A0AAV6VYG1_9ARAC|nr:hypothetical protein JTE90_015772 [Oedothorax gibbosus]